MKRKDRPDAERRPGNNAPVEGPERLQKLLARAGYGSRRKCEELIKQGAVTIDGAVVTELGTKADLEAQDVRVEGRRLRVETPVYYLLNKPRNVLCTAHDPQGRQTVLDLVKDRRRIFPVGRLDAESRGAVILTNDGSFTNLLTHPRYGVEKTYLIRVRGEVSDSAINKLRQGVWLSEGRTLPARVWVMKKKPDETELGIGISEGKNRQIRRMLATVGYKVLALTRTRIGPLTLRGIGEGSFRELTKDEVLSLKRLARKNAQAPQTKPRGKRSRTRSPGKPDPATFAGAGGRRPPQERAPKDERPRDDDDLE